LLVAALLAVTAPPGGRAPVDDAGPRADAQPAMDVAGRAAPDAPATSPASCAHLDPGARSAGQSVLCAVPPVPRKEGFVAAAQRFGPSRRRDDHRSPFDVVAAFRQQPDTVRAVGIMVDFEDQPMDSTRAYFERVLFHQNQYWEQVTYGQVVIAATIPDSIYRMPETMAYYGEDELFGERQTEFVRDAVLVADDEVDYADYDAVFCIHAGGGQEADVRGDSPEQLWSVFVPLDAIAYYLDDENADRGIQTNDMTSGGEPYFVEMALVLPESESQDADDAGNPFVFGMLGVYAHEFGHVLGLPDLYDTTPEDFPDSQGIGSWGVMGAGTWNFNGFVPAQPCVWSRFELGLIDPVIVTADTTLELAAVEGQGDGPRAALIPLGGDEYFLIENRLQDPDGDGEFDFYDADDDSVFTLYDLTIPAEEADSYRDAEFDFFLPGEGTGSGLLIWHIDQSVLDAYDEYNAVEHDPEHKGVDLEEADGIEDLDTYATTIENFGSAGDVFRAGEADEFGPATIPSTALSYGAPSFVRVHSISGPGSIMSFSVTFEDAGTLPRRKSGFTPVQLAGPVQGNHPACGDLCPDWPGLETVVVDSLGSVYVIDAAGGSPYPGRLAAEPLGSVGPDAATTPALGDLDGDGNLDLLVVGSDGRVFAWDGATGEELLDGDGDPSTTGVWAELEGTFAHTVPVIAQVTEDPQQTVFVGSMADSATGDARLYWLMQRQDAVEIGYGVVRGDLLAPPLLFRGRSSPGAELRYWLVGASVFDDATHYFEAWPTTTQPIVELPNDRASLQHQVRSLVAADLDLDGTMEILASDDHGRIECYRYPRRPPATINDIFTDRVRLEGVIGWPFELGLGVAHDLSLADLDRDAHLEVLLSAYDGRLYALNWNGTPQRGFPVQVGDGIRPIPTLVPAPLVMDLDGDERPEIVAAAGDGRLLAVEGDGSQTVRFAVPGPGEHGPTPVVTDLDGDGVLDALVPSDHGVGSLLIAYELPGTVDPAPPWGAYRNGPGHSGQAVVMNVTAESRPFLSEVYVYPNPVRGGMANIHFSLGMEARVDLKILDASGRVVAEPRVAQAPAPGLTEHVVAWSTDSEPSGVYLLRVDAAAGGREESEVYTFAVMR
ncbi:MAG: M6 family metalloprotease domain-containing protein, partial [Candidatus Eiseniibacteriota bacterium]